MDLGIVGDHSHLCSPTAITTIQLANSYVDFYNYFAISTISNLTYIHFDNCVIRQRVDAFWTQFIVNAKSAIEDSTKKLKTIEVITLLGNDRSSVNLLRNNTTHTPRLLCTQ